MTKISTDPPAFRVRPAQPEEAGAFFAQTSEQDAQMGAIGHVRMDFGGSGKEFWHTWHPRGEESLNTPEFKAELQQVVDKLRETVLKDLSSMRRFCYENGGKIPGGWSQNYGYVVETEHYEYCLRCNPVPGDYQAYLPYQNKGVMIGSEKPTMVACPNALCKDEYELSWEGTYEYFDLTTGAVRAIRDPNTFYIAATSVGLTDQSNYTTTINGKSIPNAQYPAGGTYSGSTSTSFGTGSQCHGFGLYIYDYLFGSSGAKCSQGFEYIGNYTQTQIKNKLQSFALGTLLRVSYSGSTSDEHTMILVGRDSTGVIIYHANWPDNGTVAISHVTWSGFAQTFPYLDFIICPHNVNVWKPYSSTQHRGACTACGTYLYGSHYAQVGGMGTCLVCGYYGNMPGLTSTGHETE